MRFHDAGVPGGRGVVSDQQFFIEFFAGAQTGDGDFDVAVRVGAVAHAQAGELDHAPGQVNNAHRLTHVEYKHIAALRHSPGLQHQLRCLRDSHEIAGDIGVRDGEWTTRCQLASKQGHHTTAGTEHVAKTNHPKAGIRLSGQGLQYQLRHAFAGTHDVGRAYCLVGGNQYKVGHAAVHGCARHVQGTKDVVANSFCRVTLYQRNMFVSCCVVHRVGAVIAKNLG